MIEVKESKEIKEEPFLVYARIRQILDKELQNPYNLKKKDFILVDENQITVQDPDNQDFFGKRERNFMFDNVFRENHDNKYIFERIIKKMVDNTLSGFNSTALAYGVTGTGKTYTMFGNIYDELNLEKGICIHVADYLFEQIVSDNTKNYSVKVSYLEIYNEQVIDLLVETSNNLMIFEDLHRGTVVQDLSEYTVANSAQLLELIISGNSRRFMAATGQNQFSSRSHAILQISIEQRQKLENSKEEVTSSKFLMVDLAGSERGGLEKGIRTQEGSNINKSLLALATCINILSDKSKKGTFVPYRNSKLTRILKDSLGGNIQTIMIACISPAPTLYDETINTLNYASRARKIQKKITKNVKEIDPKGPEFIELVDNLKLEIEKLKDIIK